MKNFTSTSYCSIGDSGLICEVVDVDADDKGESCILIFLSAIVCMFFDFFLTCFDFFLIFSFDEKSIARSEKSKFDLI
jgi:hypothetical protein